MRLRRQPGPGDRSPDRLAWVQRHALGARLDLAVVAAPDPGFAVVDAQLDLRCPRGRRRTSSCRCWSPAGQAPADCRACNWARLWSPPTSACPAGQPFDAELLGDCRPSAVGDAATVSRARRWRARGGESGRAGRGRNRGRTGRTDRRSPGDDDGDQQDHAGAASRRRVAGMPTGCNMVSWHGISGAGARWWHRADMSGKFPVWHAGRVELASSVLEWYRRSPATCRGARRAPTPWAVLVSEIMLQQTPVARVVPAWIALADPLADARGSGAALDPARQCGCGASSATRGGRCGCTNALSCSPSDSEVRCRPTSMRCLRCPASALHGPRGRRVRLSPASPGGRHQRAPRGRASDSGSGRSRPGGAGPRAGRGRGVAAREAEPAARFSVALMELGALVCTARNPRCASCPLAASCAWRAAGSPAYAGRATRAQRFAGTDRQVRGLLLDVLRGATIRSTGPRSMSSGPIRCSASAPSTRSSSTAWSIRCPTVDMPYRASG